MAETENKTQRHTVMIVDDDPSNRKILTKYLEKDGYIVMTTEDAKSAISMLDVVTPDVILMDYQMPELNGIDALQKIRTTNRRSVIIIMTAYSSEEVAIKSIRNDADDFFSKPLDFNNMGNMIANHIKRKKELFPDAEIKPEKEDIISHFILLQDSVPIYSLGSWDQSNEGYKGEPDKEMSESLISGFISAIQGFSSSIFGQNLSEISMGEYQLVFGSKKNVLACCTIPEASYRWISKNGYEYILRECLDEILNKVLYMIDGQATSQLHPLLQDYINDNLRQTTNRIYNMG